MRVVAASHIANKVGLRASSRVPIASTRCSLVVLLWTNGTEKLPHGKSTLSITATRRYYNTNPLFVVARNVDPGATRLLMHSKLRGQLAVPVVGTTPKHTQHVDAAPEMPPLFFALHIARPPAIHNQVSPSSSPPQHQKASIRPLNTQLFFHLIRQSRP